MLESGVRHVPVVDARRRLLGVVSDVDLVGLGWRSPLQLRSRIESATDVPGVAAAGLDLPRIVAGLVDEGADPIDVAGMVTLVIDALSQRFIELAVERLGAPPVPWAWMMLGSAARREQAAITDQDHALAFELNGEPLEEVDGYFLELATAVTSGLEAAGIPRCHADVVAENRSLRRPLDHWVAAFNGWMDDPGSSRAGFDPVRSTAVGRAPRGRADTGCDHRLRRDQTSVHREAREAGIDVPVPPTPVRTFPFGARRRASGRSTSSAKGLPRSSASRAATHSRRESLRQARCVGFRAPPYVAGSPNSHEAT
jgi:CBS domain-containing protein